MKLKTCINLSSEYLDETDEAKSDYINRAVGACAVFYQHFDFIAPKNLEIGLAIELNKLIYYVFQD